MHVNECGTNFEYVEEEENNIQTLTTNTLQGPLSDGSCDLHRRMELT